MRANVMPGPSTAELNGLNWHVQVDPLSLSITSLPDTFVVVGAVDVVPEEEVPEEDLPPQAANSMHTAATAISQVKRFIDTLLESRCRRSLRRVAGLDIWEIPKQNEYIA